MFSVDSCTGKFTALAPTSVSTGYASPQTDSEVVVADPLGRFLYVANPVSNVSSQSTISMYTIDSTTGVLTPTSPATVPTGWFPQGMVVDPLGRFAYTANSDDSSISMFTVNQSTGVLTPTTPSSVSAKIPGQLLSQPDFLTVDPTGRFLYAPTLDSENASVAMFTIDKATGVLTPTSPATVPAFGSPFQVAVTPSAKFLYVVNNDSDGSKTQAIEAYSVNTSSGVLTPISAGAPVPVAGGGATAIAIDPTSRFAYVTNRSDNSISMYKIDPDTGALTLNTSTQAPLGISGLAGISEPFRINFDPSGKFVYVTNEQGPLSVFTVASDGTLLSAGSTGATAGALSTTFASGTGNVE